MRHIEDPLPDETPQGKLNLHASFSKSLVVPIKGDSMGIRTLLVRAVVMFPKAPPMMTPTARSTTLPRMTNALNSRVNFTHNPFLQRSASLVLGK